MENAFRNSGIFTTVKLYLRCLYSGYVVTCIGYVLQLCKLGQMNSKSAEMQAAQKFLSTSYDICLLESPLSIDSSLALGINIASSVEREHLTFKLVSAESQVKVTSLTEVFPIPSHKVCSAVNLPD